MTDSTYTPTESDTESNITSELDEPNENTNESNNITTIGDLTDDELADLTTHIYEELDEYITTNVLELSSPTFYEKMTEYVTETIHDMLLCVNGGIELDDNDDSIDEHLVEFIEQTVEVFLKFYKVPLRSIKYTTSNDTIEKIDQEKIEQIDSQITHLLSIPQPIQKSKEWHEFRYNMISASNLSKVFGSESQTNSLIYEKCKPLDLSYIHSTSCNTESPMHWGVKYEPVTVELYEYMFQTKIGEFGCIPHPQYSFIGASPDGINIDPENPRFGRMLEIKNTVSREITGIPKEEYWVQTQIQMETCDLDECDFVETHFVEYPSATDFYEDTEHEYKGVILYFIDRPTNSFTQNAGAQTNKLPKYIYMPIEHGLDAETIDEWTAQQKIEQKANNLVLFSTIYWYLEEFSCVLIPRNKYWFNAAVTKIEAVWQTILKERVDGYDHRASKKRIQKINITSSNDASNSYVIKNMPTTNSICLIRFDSDGNVV
jgi:putative phage-type endonuclease